MGAKFGDPKNPLLVSVRSGARASMPGMMDTILNLGLNDDHRRGAGQEVGQRALRLRQLPPLRRHVRRRRAGHEARAQGGPRPVRGHPVAARSSERGVQNDSDLDAEALKELVAEFKAEIKDKKGARLPQRSLRAAARAPSWPCSTRWENDRAILYRRLNNIPVAWGTAVNVQAMVFGNKGDDSRHRRLLHPRPGQRRERVLRRVPGQRPGRGRGGRHPHARRRSSSWSNVFPKAYKQLLDIRKKLEKHYRDMQDIEFTIEGGKLYMLQCRNGKRTGFAGVRIAVRDGRREADHQGRGPAPGGARGAEPAAAPGVRAGRPRPRPSASGTPAGQGAARRPRRRHRQDRVLRRRRRGSRPPGARS